MGGSPVENAAITRRILEGEQGPRREAVLLHAAAALYTAGKTATLAEGVKLAADTIDSGKALQKLNDFIRYSNEI